MVKKLEIRIGAHRDDAVLAHINDSSRPTIIDTPLFVGRVLVKIRDYDGVTPDGGPPTRDHVYFDKRNRRFDMQIEGRFKARPGVAPYRGDEVEFGTDFDHLVSFPMTPFKLGMRVAKSIDPNTHYDFSPPSGRPFIMSPYAACMNTLSAWPSPARYGDALVALYDPQGAASGSRDRSDSLQDIVPVEASRTPRKVWHFLGLKGAPKVDALIAKNRHLMPEPVTAASPAPARRPLPRHQSSFGLRVDRDDSVELANRQKHAELVKKADKPDKPAGRFSSLTSKFSNLTASGQKGASTTRPAMPTISSDENSPFTSEAEDDVAPLSAPNSVTPTAVPEIKGVAKGDLTFASSLRLADVNAADPVEAALGAWRFSDPAAEPMEDNLFVFQDESVPVAKRRKHFSKAEALRNFTYDPDVVYGTSFFSPFMDFNKFNLSIGPVNMNVASYFSDMPVRYTLRSTRLVPGTMEEEVFVTISFQLVDHP